MDKISANRRMEDWIIMNRRLQLLKYLIFDFLSAIVSWSSFLYFRSSSFQSLIQGTAVNEIKGKDYIPVFLLIPFFWLFLYYISGYYNEVFRKSRLSELGQTLGVSCIGAVFLIFLYPLTRADWCLNPFRFPLT
jgi:hypothetical protein